MGRVVKGFLLLALAVLLGLLAYATWGDLTPKQSPHSETLTLPPMAPDAGG